jgi:hypothetical protein
MMGIRAKREPPSSHGAQISYSTDSPKVLLYRKKYTNPNPIRQASNGQSDKAEAFLSWRAFPPKFSSPE